MYKTKLLVVLIGQICCFAMKSELEGSELFYKMFGGSIRTKLDRELL